MRLPPAACTSASFTAPSPHLTKKALFRGIGKNLPRRRAFASFGTDRPFGAKYVQPRPFYLRERRRLGIHAPHQIHDFFGGQRKIYFRAFFCDFPRQNGVLVPLFNEREIPFFDRLEGL